MNYFAKLPEFLPLFIHYIQAEIYPHLIYYFVFMLLFFMDKLKNFLEAFTYLLVRTMAKENNIVELYDPHL